MLVGLAVGSLFAQIEGGATQSARLPTDGYPQVGKLSGRAMVAETQVAFGHANHSSKRRHERSCNYNWCSNAVVGTRPWLFFVFTMQDEGMVHFSVLNPQNGLDCIPTKRYKRRGQKLR